MTAISTRQRPAVLCYVLRRRGAFGGERGVSFSSHSAVLSAYGQQFAKTRALDPRFHRALLGAYSQRQLGDYAVNSSLTDDDIQRLMSDAVDFIAAARAWFAQR